MMDGQPTTSESEIRESWQTDGYLLLRGAIPPAELEPMQDFISAAVDEQARAEHAADRLGSLYADLPFGRRVAAMHEELPNSATRLFGTPRGRHTRAFYDMYAHRGITSVLPIFLGPEITLHAITKIRGKLQDDAKTDIPWHQDSHYFNGVQEGRRMDGTEHMHIVTAWVPLVDTDEENGCLWVVPGSHRAGLVDWGMRTRQIVRELLCRCRWQPAMCCYSPTSPSTPAGAITPTAPDGASTSAITRPRRRCRRRVASGRSPKRGTTSVAPWERSL